MSTTLTGDMNGGVDNQHFAIPWSKLFQQMSWRVGVDDNSFTSSQKVFPQICYYVEGLAQSCTMECPDK